MKSIGYPNPNRRYGYPDPSTRTRTRAPLCWLPIHLRIDFKLLLLAYKALNGSGPRYLADLRKWHRPLRQLRSASDKLLEVPRSNLKRYGDRSFQVVAPKLWNSIPQSVRDSKTTNSFKRTLKTHFFRMHHGE